MDMKNRAKTRQELQDDARVDEAIAESFPASDAPSYNRGVEDPAHTPQGFLRPEKLKWTTIEGGKAMNQQEERGGTFGYLIGGFVLGAVAGLLLAPKKGSELMEDINDWGRDTRDKGRDLYARAKEYIPHRVKRSAAEAVNAAREAGEQAYRGVKDKSQDFGS
jgi:gas vesicle protein